MNESHSTTPPAADKEPRRFLVGSIKDNQHIIKTCETATTLLCTELATGLDAIIAIPCKRWGCRWCGRRKAFGLAMRVQLAEPNRFLTLTVNPAHFSTPREAYDCTRRKISDLSKAIRLHAGSFEYCRVLEATKKGWPHYHLLVRSGFIRQQWLSDAWAASTGAPIVDIRLVKKSDNVFKYMLKYLCKQSYIPWTNRRVCWSRDFFPKVTREEGYQNPYVNRRRLIKHPTEALNRYPVGTPIVERKSGVWVVEEL